MERLTTLLDENGDGRVSYRSLLGMFTRHLGDWTKRLPEVRQPPHVPRLEISESNLVFVFCLYHVSTVPSTASSSSRDERQRPTRSTNSTNSPTNFDLIRHVLVGVGEEELSNFLCATPPRDRVLFVLRKNRRS